MLKLLTAMLATFQNQSQTQTINLLNSSRVRGLTNSSLRMLQESRSILAESASCFMDGNASACEAINAKSDAMLTSINDQATDLGDGFDRRAKDVKGCFIDDDASPNCKTVQSAIYEAKVTALGLFEYSASKLAEAATELCFSVEQARMRLNFF